MTEMKKYMEIPRLGHKETLDYFAQIASKGLNIRIGVKLDGANGQIEVNSKGELLSYSRNNLLTEEMNLSGFYQYVLDKVDPTLLPKNIKIFGEWLVPHKIVYPKDAYKKFYIFSMYDPDKKEYISPDSDVYKNIEAYLVNHCGMEKEIVVYEGPYLGIEHIQNIANEVTKEGIEYTRQQPETMDDVFHEGIVVKAHDYRNPYGDQLFVKIVGERFKEIKKVKYKDKTPGPDLSVEGKIVDFAVTEARIEKMLYKLVDEGILPEGFDLEQMPIIARNLPKRIYEDIMKEELDTIKDEFGEFDPKVIGKKISSKTMTIAKDIIKKKIEERLSELT